MIAHNQYTTISGFINDMIMIMVDTDWYPALPSIQSNPSPL